ncbi:MAG TPA: hypothetical protein VL947_00260, partial [Cytophagales bacterium]|nr:hypothetical protein [Cytophagales bacterium]
MKRSNLLLHALLCMIGQVMSQEVNLYPSPQAAALVTYASEPVDYSTGIPNIGIPIYSLKTKNGQVPIGLSYHINNNKVYDIPTWVGLGW